MADDIRREFLVGAVLDAVAPAGSRDELFMQLVSDPNGAMRAFLDDQTTMVFQATLAGGQLVSSNVVSFDPSSSSQVVLTKLKAGALSAADIPANVAVSSMSHSPVSALYHQLHSVYGPLLSDDKGGGVDAKLRGLVAELEAGLGNVLRLTGGVDGHAGDVDPAEAPLVGIVTPLDEWRFWSEIAFAHGAPQRLRASAAEVYRAFEPAKERFERLDNLPDEEVLELVEILSDCADNAWRVPSDVPGQGAFTQRRAEHLMRIVGSSLVGHVQRKLREMNVWTDPFKSVEGALRFGHRCLAKWERAAADLSGMNWADGGGGAQSWRGPVFHDPVLAKARARLDEVFKMREAQAELAKLLTDEEANSLTLSEVFRPFAGVDPLQVSKYTEPLWEAACSDYDQRMRPIEDRMSQKLREHFGARLLPALAAAVKKQGDERGAAMAQPHQVLREVARYSELLRRPTVAIALAMERKQLGDSLEEFLSDIKAECDREEARAMGQRQGGVRLDATRRRSSRLWSGRCKRSSALRSRRRYAPPSS